MNENTKKVALVVGNGPSVNSLDPALLSQVESFGSNHIYHKFAEWGRGVDQVLITDSNRIKEIKGAYKDFPGQVHVGHENYIVPPRAWIESTLQRRVNLLVQLPKRKWPVNAITRRLIYPVKIHPLIFDKLRFTFDPQKGFNFGYSVVTSAIQLAVFQGFKTICLVGVDSHYSHPKAYFEGMSTSVSFVNDAFVSNPRIFMEPVLVSLQLFLEPLGIRLVDCSVGGALRFIEKSTLEEVLASPAQKVQHG